MSIQCTSFSRLLIGERSTLKGFSGWVSDFSTKSMEMQDTDVSSKRRRIKSRDRNATNLATQDLLTPPSPARRNPVCSTANLFHLQIYEASNPSHFDEKSVDIMHM